MGVAVWDADETVHRLLRSHAGVIRAVRRRFGPAVVRSVDGIDRPKLARIVFRDAEARRDLEAIVHPRVLADLRRWLGIRRRVGGPAVAVVPLLFEKGWDRWFDMVVCVSAPRPLAIQRLRRRGMTAAEARRRIAAQWPLRRKCAMADVVIRNDGTRAALARAVRRWWRTLRFQPE